MNIDKTGTILDQVQAVLEARKQAIGENIDQVQDTSYVAGLYTKGLDAILKKVGEEATETVMAAKDGDADKIIYEVTDLWFHCMVLLVQQGLSVQQVLDELTRRFGVSGVTEKANR